MLYSYRLRAPRHSRYQYVQNEEKEAHESLREGILPVAREQGFGTGTVCSPCSRCRRSLAAGFTAIPQVFLVVKLDGMLLRRRVRIGPNRVRRLLAGNFHLTREHDFTSRWVELRTGK